MSRPVLSDILGHAGRNGLYRLPAGLVVADAVMLDGHAFTGKSAMLDALAKALAFPDWFGFNWDALEECLADLSWHGDAVVLLIDAADVPEDRAPEEWGMLLDILADVAREWASEGRPFAVFLRGGHAAYPLVSA